MDPRLITSNNTNSTSQTGQIQAYTTNYNSTAYNTSNYAQSNDSTNDRGTTTPDNRRIKKGDISKMYQFVYTDITDLNNLINLYISVLTNALGQVLPKNLQNRSTCLFYNVHMAL